MDCAVRTSRPAGANNGWARSFFGPGWNAVFQTVPLQPNKRYRILGFVRSSSTNTDGYLGIWLPSTGVILGQQKFGSLPNYTAVVIDFNSGNNTSAELFGGLWGNFTDAWAQFDDIALFQL